ncbi:MAG: arylsulfatase A-like enzyme [Planctomycetota bacterium]|jgi:arylsulfatase A-like enzyme
MLSWVTQLAGKPHDELTEASRVRTSRPMVWALTAMCFALMAACEEKPRPGVPPRHIVLVTVDTLSADRMSSLGHSRATTDLAGVLSSAGEIPEHYRSLDRLAAEGVLFARAFAPRGMTFPSMATVFTGRSPLEHGAIDNGNLLCESVPTLAASLSAAGFETAGFTANQLLAVRSGIERGFDHFFTDISVERDLQVVMAATAWLRERDLERGPPLFMWLHLMGPHIPYEPTELQDVDYQALFADPNYSGAANGSREFLDEVYGAGTLLESKDVEHIRALYDGEVARVDHLIALFTEILSGTLDVQPVNVLDDALFVFAADHGEELHRRGNYWAHSKSVYDTVLHVPLFIRHPSSLTGRRVIGELVELQDLMPTVLDWFNVPSPSGVRGRSLLPLMDGDEFESRGVFGHWRDQIFTVRTEKWRYVWNPNGVEPSDPPSGAYPIAERALYDVRADPFQVHDLLKDKTKIGIELEQLIVDWQSQLNPVCDANGTISPERLQDLKDLGYVDDGEEDPRSPTAKDVEE